MANGTTITESGTELQPARPGEERGTATGWVQDLLFTVDHKKLGILYVGTGLFFFVLAGIMALLIRAQLAFPNGHVTSPQEFNALITVHGTVMIFWVAMPIDLWDDQLSGPADDRGAGHGVSKAERIFVLVDFLQWIFPLPEFRCGSRPLWCQWGSGRGLVRHRAADLFSLFQRA